MLLNKKINCLFSLLMLNRQLILKSINYSLFETNKTWVSDSILCLATDASRDRWEQHYLHHPAF